MYFFYQMKILNLETDFIKGKTTLKKLDFYQKSCARWVEYKMSRRIVMSPIGLFHKYVCVSILRKLQLLLPVFVDLRKINTFITNLENLVIL